MKQAKKLKIKVIAAAIVVLLALTVASILYFHNKVSADQKNSAKVVEPGDVYITTPTVATTENDTRKEVAVPILMYHHIRNFNDPNDSIGTSLSVPTENFKAQIDYLKINGFTTITFTDFLSFPGKKLPEKPVILTFDDGYNDAYDNAYLALKANNQVGVFYIISGFLGRSDSLSYVQLKAMSDGGMEIGSHTVDHPDLTKISSAKLNNELVDSKNVLEKIIGKSALSFCYPSGKYNDVVESAVKNAGYTSASTEIVAVSTTSKKKLLLPRLRITPSTTIADFAKKILSSKK